MDKEKIQTETIIFRFLTRLPFLKSPFFYILLPSLFFYVIIFGRHWIPIHDTFQLSNILYYFFNEYALNGHLPLWYPYINFGINTNWYLVFSFGPSASLLILIAKIFSNVNFLHFYYLMFLGDELILLVGTYMLSRILLKNSLAAVFVSITMAGSTLWYAQPWFNFHLYYFLPLSLYFCIQGCQESSVWKIFFGGTILVLTSFGNLPYFPIIQGVTFLVFFIVAVWSYDFNVKRALKNIGKAEVIVFILLVLSTVSFLFIMKYGAHSINYNDGRENGNIVNLEGFLTYGGSIGLSKFSELFTGTSWNLDINIYAGILVFSFALFGLIWVCSRHQLPFLATAIFLFLISLGKSSFMAPLIYHLPGICYYRHIGLILPLIKVMLILLSGFGFDAFITSIMDGNEEQDSTIKTVVWVNTSLIVGMLLICVTLTAAHLIAIKKFNVVDVFNPISLDSTNSTTRFFHFREYMSRVSFVITLYMTSILVFVMLGLRGKKLGSAAIYLLLAVQIIDVYSYRSSMFLENMIEVNETCWNLFKFRRDPFVTSRIRNYFDTENYPKLAPFIANNKGENIDREWFNNREYYDKNSGKFFTRYFPNCTKQGVYYNTLEPFLGIDPCRSIFKVDFWLPGIDKLYRAETRLPIDDLSILPQDSKYRTIRFPMNDLKFNKIIGCGYPKIQIFRDIHILQTEEELAKIIGNDRYTGDLLLTSGKSFEIYQRCKTNNFSKTIPSNGQDSVTQIETGNVRVPAKISVEGFSANTIKIHIILPNDQDHYWLYYADAWHSFWKATVNNKSVPILKVNLGFKAVEIPSGESVVEFNYSSVFMSFFIVLVCGLLVGVMGYILWMAGHLLVRFR